MSERKFQFGVSARDVISGYRGVIIAYANYMTGCDQYLLTPIVKDDNTAPEARWLDEGRIEAIDVAVVSLPSPPPQEQKRGADIPAPMK